ncbi:MAG: hypothetical protein ACT4O9_03880 [Blastocatellia bacterium]
MNEKHLDEIRKGMLHWQTMLDNIWRNAKHNPDTYKCGYSSNFADDNNTHNIFLCVVFVR